MARYSDTIDTTEKAIRDFAENLRTLAADFDEQADKMVEHKLTSIAVTHWKSARDGVKGYAAFAAAIKKSLVYETQLSAVNSLLKDTPTIQESQQSVAATHEQRKQQNQGKAKRKSNG